MTPELSQIEQNFHELIIKYCKLFHFDDYADNPDFQFPQITPESSNREQFFAIPGMFGGLSYFLDEQASKTTLYVERSSRMDYNPDAYGYFAITAEGTKTLQDAERQATQDKFRELDRKAHAEHKSE